MEILVLGVAFTDIKGFPFGVYDPVGTNHGDVKITHGGVARNVAEDLAIMGARVEFPLLLDKTPLSDSVRARLEIAGIDLTNAVYVPEDGLGLWLAVFNEKGDLAGSISKMPDVSALEDMIREKGEALIRKADAVVVEFDTSPAIARMVCDRADLWHKDIYAIVGNMSGILACPDLMARTRTVIMNGIEAGKMFGVSLEGKKPEEVLAVVIAEAGRMGLKSIVVTLGAEGCIYADRTAGEYGIVPAEPCRVVDTTGAGDAFFSAAVLALTGGDSLRTACEKGTHAAARVLATEESVFPKED